MSRASITSIVFNVCANNFYAAGIASSEIKWKN